MIFLCFNRSPFFIFKFWTRKCITVPLFCIVLYILFSFFPYPRKLNDNGSYSTIVSYGYSYRITGADLGGGGGGGGGEGG